MITIEGIERNIPRLIHHKCLDCNHPSEYYMIKDEIWKKYVPEDKGDKNILGEFRIDEEGYDYWHSYVNYHLCLSCLSKRIGRELIKEDFSDCPLNYDYILTKRKVKGKRKRVLAIKRPDEVNAWHQYPDPKRWIYLN